MVVWVVQVVVKWVVQVVQVVAVCVATLCARMTRERVEFTLDSHGISRK